MHKGELRELDVGLCMRKYARENGVGLLQLSTKLFPTYPSVHGLMNHVLGVRVCAGVCVCVSVCACVCVCVCVRVS